MGSVKCRVQYVAKVWSNGHSNHYLAGVVSGVAVAWRAGMHTASCYTSVQHTAVHCSVLHSQCKDLAAHRAARRRESKVCSAALWPGASHYLLGSTGRALRWPVHCSALATSLHCSALATSLHCNALATSLPMHSYELPTNKGKSRLNGSPSKEFRWDTVAGKGRVRWEIVAQPFTLTRKIAKIGFENFGEIRLENFAEIHYIFFDEICLENFEQIHLENLAEIH